MIMTNDKFTWEEGDVKIEEATPDEIKKAEEIEKQAGLQHNLAAMRGSAAPPSAQPINLNLNITMPEGKPVKKTFKIEKQNGQFHGTVEETPTP